MKVIVLLDQIQAGLGGKEQASTELGGKKLAMGAAENSGPWKLVRSPFRPSKSAPKGRLWVHLNSPGEPLHIPTCNWTLPIKSKNRAIMMHSILFVVILGAMAVVNAAPASTTVNPDAVTGTKCTDPST